MKNAVIVSMLMASLASCATVPTAQPRQTSTMETVGMVAAGGALVFLLFSVNASKVFKG